MTDTPGTVAPADPTLFDVPGSTDPALDDQAAEVDDVPADAGGQDTYTADVEPAYTGVCRGGPYDGRTVKIRFPEGFLLYDKPNERLWTYDARNPGEFIATGGGPTNGDTSVDSLIPVAEGIQYDVLAYDDGPAVT